MTTPHLLALVLLAVAGSAAVVGAFALVAEALGRPAGGLLVLGCVVMFGAGFTSCTDPPLPPPVRPTPPPDPVAACDDACAHLANIGCSDADECGALCRPVQLPGYATCLLKVQEGHCEQADACDTDAPRRDAAVGFFGR